MASRLGLPLFLFALAVTLLVILPLVSNYQMYPH